MNGLDQLLACAGNWRGVNRLWVSADQPPDESVSLVTVMPFGDRGFVRLEQRWAREGKPQAGTMILGYDGETKLATARWIDSFHTGGETMECSGVLDGEGAADVRGSYAAPPGPDWGWRIRVAGEAGRRLEIEMYNIDPAGKEALAVRAGHERG